MPAVARQIVDGPLAAAAQLAAGSYLATRTGGCPPVTAIGRTAIDLSPGPGVDIVVATAEAADKVLLRATIVGAWLATGASRRPGAALAGWAALAGAAAAHRRDAATGASLAATAGGSLAAAAALNALTRRPTRATRLAVGTATVAALAAARTRRSAVRAGAESERASLPPSPAPADRGFRDVPGLSPLFTPPDRFYTTDVAFDPAPVRLADWRLRVTGMVDRPLEFSHADLLAMDPIELDATLVCVHNPVGGPRIGSARWLGVPLVRLLERAGVHRDAEQIVARSVDGFTAGVPVSHIRRPEDAIVALGMNGEPLPFNNGFPARLLTPGLWGADANTKWLSELELTTWDAVRDYWDRRGWPRQPSAVRPGARIDTPAHRGVVSSGPVTIAGVAWAPPQGVEAVEVSVDGGAWQPAELSDDLAPTLWRQWRLEWPASGGGHTIAVRTRGRDRLQSEHRQPPYPVGSSGHHTVRVDVVDGAVGSAAKLRGRLRGGRDDLGARVRLAGDGVRAWHARGYPPAPRWPAPR